MTAHDLHSGAPVPATDTDVLIAEARGLRKRFKALQAVDDVSFRVIEGETYGLLGPNGAGKTTTILMLAGLLEPDAGDVMIGGVPIRPGSTRGRDQIGWVPQEIAIYPDLTADENLKLFGRLQGMGGRDLGRRIDEVLEVIGLTDRRSERTGTYSGGMKRRLNIGIGLLHRPRLLILDEPTVGVDPQSRNAILESVEALSAEGMAVLYTTHYMEEAERLCDRVGIIDQGRLVAEGTRRELVAMMGEKDRVTIELAGETGAITAGMAALREIGDVVLDGRTANLITDDASRRLSSIITALADHHVDVGSLSIIQPDLEAVFLHLTGKALRD